MSEVVPKILDKARADPSILLRDYGKAGWALIFCHSSESVALERDRIKDAGKVSPSLCVVAMDQYGIRVNQECGDESRDRMAKFVTWILTEYAPCVGLDDDTGEDLSSVISSDPTTLFR